MHCNKSDPLGLQQCLCRCVSNGIHMDARTKYFPARLLIASRLCWFHLPVFFFYVVAYQSYVHLLHSLFHFFYPLALLIYSYGIYKPELFSSSNNYQTQAFMHLHLHCIIIGVSLKWIRKCFLFSNVCLNEALMLANYGLTVQLYTSALASTQY